MSFKYRLHTDTCIYSIIQIKPTCNAGISLRWILGTLGESTQVLLMAQALPCSTSVINANPSLQTDHTRGVLVGRYPVKYDEFDNRMAAGLIPTFFSSKPEQTMVLLKDNPEFAFKCLQALVSRLLVRKELTRYRTTLIN